MVAISSVMVPLTTSHRKEKQELIVLHQLVNWFVAGMVLTFSPLSRNLHARYYFKVIFSISLYIQITATCCFLLWSIFLYLIARMIFLNMHLCLTKRQLASNFIVYGSLIIHYLLSASFCCPGCISYRSKANSILAMISEFE